MAFPQRYSASVVHHDHLSLSPVFIITPSSFFSTRAALVLLPDRAEPILQRIKEDRTRVVSPSFDNIKYDTFEIEEYPLSAQGFDWELWCRYLNPPKSWWSQRNHTAPIR